MSAEGLGLRAETTHECGGHLCGRERFQIGASLARPACLFQAEEAGHVERLNREAGIPFDRVSEAMYLPPG